MEKNVAVGRRKSAIARVFINKGKGNIVINGKDIKDYIPTAFLQDKIYAPLKVSDSEGKYDLKVNVRGGGIKGQTEAIQLGIARALTMVDPDCRPELKRNKMLVRDARVVERKKSGFRKARKKEQYSKR